MTIWLVVMLVPKPLERVGEFQSVIMGFDQRKHPRRTLPSSQRNFHQEQHAFGLEGACERADEAMGLHIRRTCPLGAVVKGVNAHCLQRMNIIVII